MNINVSWDKNFEELMLYLKLKYKEEMFNLDGIGEEVLDLNKFSKNFFINQTTTADVSVDSNSNVVSKTGVEYSFELPKPLRRYNSYYMLWKQLKKQFGQDFANKAIEMQLCGDIYINDFVDICSPYSYHPDNVITINQTPYTFKDFFDTVKLKHTDKYTKKDDRDEIDLRNQDYYVFDGNKNVKILCAIKHKSHTDLVRITTNDYRSIIVTTDHPVVTKQFLNGIPASDIKIGDELIPTDRFPIDVSDNEQLEIDFTNNFDDFCLPKNWNKLSIENREKIFIDFLETYSFFVNSNTMSNSLYFKTKNYSFATQFLGLLESINCQVFNFYFDNNYYYINFKISTKLSFNIKNTRKDYTKYINDNKKRPCTVQEKKIIKYVGNDVYDIQTESGYFSCGGLYCHNCFNYSTNDIAYNGLKGISKRLDVKPPKSFNTFIRQVEQFVVYAANSTLGAK